MDILLPLCIILCSPDCLEGARESVMHSSFKRENCDVNHPNQSLWNLSRAPSRQPALFNHNHYRNKCLQYGHSFATLHNLM